MMRARKKELKARYKEMKPDRGLFAVRCLETGEMYLEATSDLNGSMNSLRLKLNNDMCRHKGLQWAWKRHGEHGFVFEILERLEDEALSDAAGLTLSSDDLQILFEIWKEKLEGEGKMIYGE